MLRLEREEGVRRQHVGAEGKTSFLTRQCPSVIRFVTTCSAIVFDVRVCLRTPVEFWWSVGSDFRSVHSAFSQDHVTFPTLTTHLDDHLQLNTWLTYKHQSLRPGHAVSCSQLSCESFAWGQVDAHQISSRLGGHFRPLVTEPQTRWRSIWDTTSMAATSGLYAIFSVDVPSNLDTCSSYCWCHGLDFHGWSRRCSHLSKWFVSLVSAPHFVDRSSGAMAMAGRWHAETHCSMGATCAVCPAQFALSFCIEAHLPQTRGTIACQQGTDNSAADAASAKGLTMTPVLAAVLIPYFKYKRRY